MKFKKDKKLKKIKNTKNIKKTKKEDFDMENKNKNEKPISLDFKKSLIFKIFSFMSIFIGFLFIIYDFVLIYLCPGTFWDNVTAFSHIWSVFGLYHIFVGIWRIKNKKIFIKEWNRKIKLTFVILFSAGILICVVNLFCISNYQLASEKDSVDYVILLGGGIDKNGVLPKSVQMRAQKTADYLNQHKNTICVVTGGTLKFLPVAEAPELKNYLVRNGVEENRILVEDKALDTIQNFEYSCEMLANYEGISKREVLQKEIIVVTSYYHLKRAEILAKRMGFSNIKGLGSNIPFINVLHCYVREICAYIKLNLRILFTGKPQLIE